jgi:hypothetical protein
MDENPVFNVVASFKNFLNLGLPSGLLGQRIRFSRMYRWNFSLEIDQPRVEDGGYTRPVAGSATS